MDVFLHWLEPGESIRYLSFAIGFQVLPKQRFKIALQNLKQKLTYWSTTKPLLAGRVLVANQILLASIWYLASCWSPHLNILSKIKSLIRNYIWSRENGERKVRAKVEWNSLIQPINQGGINLINPVLQIQAF